MLEEKSRRRTRNNHPSLFLSRTREGQKPFLIPTEEEEEGAEDELWFWQANETDIAEYFNGKEKKDCLSIEKLVETKPTCEGVGGIDDF